MAFLLLRILVVIGIALMPFTLVAAAIIAFVRWISSRRSDAESSSENYDVQSQQSESIG